jgi:hypothetical protein
MKYPSLLLAALALAGCNSNAYLERLEAQDDASCRKIVAQRNDASPQAYTQCRANMQHYRQQTATVAAGAAAGVMAGPDGPPRHWSLE